MMAYLIVVALLAVHLLQLLALQSAMRSVSQRVDRLEEHGGILDADLMTEAEVAEVIRQQLHIAATRTFGSHAEWRNL